MSPAEVIAEAIRLDGRPRGFCELRVVADGSCSMAERIEWLIRHHSGELENQLGVQVSLISGTPHTLIAWR